MSESKIALVTGATRGIGKAIALQLAADGMTVIGTATSDGGAEKISAYLKEAGNGGCGMCLDVSDAESIATVITAIQKEYGVPTVLVNNAGITRDNLLMRMSDDEWQSVIDTNLTSIFRVSKALVRGMMKARWGRIINVGSVVGTSGNAGQANYCAAKAGLVGFSKALAKEVASRNITVNVVAPGFIDTDMTRDLDESWREVLLKSIPAGAMGQPSDIAKAVGYLASDGAGYMTGQTLHVNGGMLMN